MDITIKDIALLLIGAAISAIPAIWIARRRWLKPELLYQYYTQIVLHNFQRLPGIKFTYNNTPVDSLYLTKIFLWNSGTSSIRKEDLVTGDRLCLKIDGKEPLNVAIANTSNKAILASLDKNENLYFLNFAYLEPMNGFRIDILHDERIIIKISGKLIGSELKSAQRPTLRTPKNPILRDLFRFLYALDRLRVFYVALQFYKFILMTMIILYIIALATFFVIPYLPIDANIAASIEMILSHAAYNNKIRYTALALFLFILLINFSTRPSRKDHPSALEMD